eukprot:TRINITY_DN3246_c0_g2_i1.p1 TRINITY_DN3246_c0_g2~~TRINITY_DN3246_c0_g2_i1.p1  ORF type:complete len:330 (+),score=39.00 TRINITY_DN3246_c0_g2_i1:279-1268(+)
MRRQLCEGFEVLNARSADARAALCWRLLKEHLHLLAYFPQPRRLLSEVRKEYTSRLGMIAECEKYLKECFHIVKYLLSKECSLRHLKHLNRLHLQYCAIMSQLNKHEQALEHAKYGLKYSSLILSKTIEIAERMCGANYSEEDNGLSASTQHKTFFVDSSKPHTTDPIIHLAASKILPVLHTLLSKITEPHSQPLRSLDMRNAFGYCQTEEWCANVNMSSVMQVSPMTLQDLISASTDELELTREFILEKISLILVSHFCISTEKRFIAASTKQSLKHAEYWHAKTLELACQFLPPECPLLLHFFNSYQKQHSVLRQSIVRLWVMVAGG